MILRDFPSPKRFFKLYCTYEVNIYAAYAAYFMLLSIFPAMMLITAILHYTPISADQLVTMLRGVVPASLFGLVEYIVQDLFAVDSVAVLSLSAITALWTASKGAYSIQMGLNKIYGCMETRHFVVVRLQGILFTLLLFAALVILVALQAIRLSFIEALAGKGWLLNLLANILRLRLPVTVVLLTLLFVGIYCVFPNRNERFWSTVPGALIGAILWVAFSWLFTFYVERFGHYSLYYGSLMMIVLAMIWLYVCMLILFCGAILNCELKRRRTLRAESRSAKEK